MTTAATLTANTFATVLGTNGRDVISIGMIRKATTRKAITTITWADGSKSTVEATRPVRAS